MAHPARRPLLRQIKWCIETCELVVCTKHFRGVEFYGIRRPATSRNVPPCHQSGVTVYFVGLTGLERQQVVELAPIARHLSGELAGTPPVVGEHGSECYDRCLVRHSPPQIPVTRKPQASVQSAHALPQRSGPKGPFLLKKHPSPAVVMPQRQVLARITVRRIANVGDGSVL